MLAYERPYRLTLVVGGLLSLATGVVGLALPLTTKRLVDDLAQDLGTATSATVFFRLLGGSLGTALFGAVLLNRFQHNLAVLLPSGPTGGRL